jgi:hypothetical protein
VFVVEGTPVINVSFVSSYHSQLIAIGKSAGRLRSANFGMDPASSIYAALQPELVLSSPLDGTRSKDATDHSCRICVIARNQCPCCIIDDSRDLDGNAPLPQSSLKHWHNIVSFDAFDIKSLGPSLQDPMIDGVLVAGIRECEPQMIFLCMREILVVLQELCKALCNIVK